MNLSKFLSEVDSLSKSMDKEELTAFVHDIARTLPEDSRGDFLIKLRKSESNNDVDFSCSSDNYTKEYKINYEKIKEGLNQIINEEIYFSGELNEEYDDWYNSEDEFIFEDPEGVGELLEDACQFIHECVDKELYKEGYEIANILIGLEIMVGGEYEDYSDEPLRINELN